MVPVSFCPQSFPASGSFPMSQFFTSGGQRSFSFSISPSNEYSGLLSFQFSSVHLLSSVQLFETPWTAARQASLSITNSQTLPKLMSIGSMMPSSHLILCRPLLLLPPIPPGIRGFSNESTLRMRWPKEFQLQHQSFQ